MRILHISTRLILGGSQENTVLSCEGQARAGHEVHLAFGPIYGPEGSLLERVRAFSGPALRPGSQRDETHVTTHEIPHLIRDISPLADRRALRELRQLIRTLKPDVVHTHSSKAGILGRAAAWAERVPAVVHTIHGPPFMPIEGSPPQRAKIRAKNHLYTMAERHAARRCHAIIGVCNAMVEQFVTRRIGRSEQYHTVYSGMEVEPYLTPAPGETRDEVRARLGLAPTDFVMGTVARLAEHKGHDDILAAIGEDLNANPHWKLLWVGDGWWRERLVARAREMGLVVAELDRAQSAAIQPGRRVGSEEHWREEQATQQAPAPHSRAHHSPASLTPQLLLTGLVPPDRIPGLMRAMDVLIHPSYREGLPRTVPQALLCGTCPIAYDCDGTVEVCKEMKTGRLVRTGDLTGLAAAIRWAAENPLPRAALAARGREECRVRFDAGRMVKELERIYSGCQPSPKAH